MLNLNCTGTVRRPQRSSSIHQRCAKAAWPPALSQGVRPAGAHLPKGGGGNGSSKNIPLHRRKNAAKNRQHTACAGDLSRLGAAAGNPPEGSPIRDHILRPGEKNNSSSLTGQAASQFRPLGERPGGRAVHSSFLTLQVKKSLSFPKIYSKKGGRKGLQQFLSTFEPPE